MLSHAAVTSLSVCYQKLRYEQVTDDSIFLFLNPERGLILCTIGFIVSDAPGLYRLLSLLVLCHLHQIDPDTDKQDGKHLRPTETVLSQNQRSNSCHYQNQITVNGYDRCLEILQTNGQQHITDGGREKQYKHQDKERSPMERQGEYRGIESGNRGHDNGRHRRTGKCVAQQGNRPDRGKNAIAQNQVDGIDYGTHQAEHIPHKSIGGQIITLLRQDADQRTDQSDGDADYLFGRRLLLIEENHNKKHPDGLKA